jgi:large subunit ribosomal protein L30
MAKTETGNYIEVTQVKSAIGRIEPQKRTIKALGLGKISSSSVLPDNPAVRGMVAAVAHLVRVETAEKPLNMSTSGARRLKSKKTARAEIAASGEIASSPKKRAPRLPAGKAGNDVSRNDVEVEAKATVSEAKPAAKKPIASKAAPKAATKAKTATVKKTAAKKTAPTKETK